METISFDKLLVKTAFCCMASDGEINPKEIALIKTLCEESSYFANFKFDEEINKLIIKLNEGGKEFIKYYFDILKNSTLSEPEELTLIDFAVKTIHADGVDEYSEIKFFKVIRHNLKVTDERIIASYPEIESWLEQDIITESYLDKITKQYLDIAELPKFELISSLDKSSLDNLA